MSTPNIIGLKAVGVNGMLTVSWSVSSTENVGGFLLHFRPVSKTPGVWSTRTLVSTARNAQIGGVANGTTYEVEVRVLLGGASSTITATVPATPTAKPIVGVNGGVGWGPEDAKFLLGAGFTGVRIEDGVIAESAQATIADKFIPSRCSVVVGNTNDSAPLTAVNIPAWVASTVERIKVLAALGFTKFEAGNEMYLKANAFDAKTYAAMVMGLYDAIDSTGLPVKVGVSCINDTPSGKATSGGGWLRELISTQPGLASRADYWITHPYPAESGKITDTGWMGNCGPEAVKTQIQIASSLGVKNNVWALTEFGVQLSGPTYATGSQEHQANMCKEYMTAFFEIPEVESLYYFQVHDTGEGTYGLVTTPSPAGPLPWEPRTVLGVVASFVS